MTTNSAASALTGAPAAPAAASAPAAGDAGAPTTPSAPAGGSAPAAAPAGDAWYSGIQNQDVRVWAEAKGFKDPLAAAESAYNLEKLIGFDRAGKTVVMPDENSPPEVRQAFLSKLGVPETVEGYKLPVPEGMPDTFAKAAASWMHEAGIPAKAGEQLAAKWNEFQTAQMTEQQQALAVKSEQEFNGLKTEWGAAFDQNLELGKRAALQFIPGDPAQRAATLQALEQAMGTGQLLKFMANVGKGLGEHKMLGGEQTGGMLTPAQAQQRIAELKSNKDWSAAYLAGDKSKNKELQDLISMANPGV